jgi:hypothetical protein
MTVTAELASGRVVTYELISPDASGSLVELDMAGNRRCWDSPLGLPWHPWTLVIEAAWTRAGSLVITDRQT